MKIETKTYNVVDWSDIDNLLISTYGNKNLCCNIHGQPNDSYITIDSVKPELTEKEEKALEYWVRTYRGFDMWDYADHCGKEYYDEYEGFDAAMNDLCRRGLIPAGNYLISVCW